MGRVSQWAVRRPVYALVTWLVMAVVIGFAGAKFGGDYNDNFELPDTESSTAQDLLGTLSGGAGTGAGLDGQIVWKADTGSVNDAATKAAMTELLTEASKTPGVACVYTPFGDPMGDGCPEPAANQGGGTRARGRASSRRCHPRARRPRPTSARPASAPTRRSPTRP